MNQDDKKRDVARAAVEQVPVGCIVGVGTGSTANHFIDALATVKSRVDAAVASSEASAKRLAQHGIRVINLSAANELELYVDGADESTRHRHLIKGGGGALTREKIVAAAARRFVCIVDDTKVVQRLGLFPLPVEVIPMARAYVSRQIVKLGGRPQWREGMVTDNGNEILDVHGLDILNPVELESELDHIAGCVTNGLFARRGADLVLVATDDGVVQLE